MAFHLLSQNFSSSRMSYLIMLYSYQEMLEKLESYFVKDRYRLNFQLLEDFLSHSSSCYNRIYP